MSKIFPKNFLLGFSSSAYQIEGAWNVGGKGENIWDRFVHSLPSRIIDESNGDIACDFYHKYEDDIKLMKDVGTQIYRFSLSWSRILPKGFSNEINADGIKFYKNLIEELLKNNIEPMVTLYHWDLPQTLQDLGGWLNPLTAEYFCDYAEVAFENFGNKVKKWITFNEPNVECNSAYNLGIFAPGIKLPGIAEYQAGHTMLKAHAMAYHLYNKKFKQEQKGEVGIAFSINWREPITDSIENKEAAEVSREFEIGWFANPIFGENGDYPELLKKKVKEKSLKEGFKKSCLPEFDKTDINNIKGSYDFFGANHYTTYLVSHKPVEDENYTQLPHRDKDNDALFYVSTEWAKANSWLYVVPFGFRKSLKWIKDKYNNPKIYVTENGVCEDATWVDDRRIKYHQDYMSEMLRAINEDGCRVLAYTIWSLTDNFEWEKGYSERFGIYFIDFKDPQRKRNRKKSVFYFKNVFKNRMLPENLDEYGVSS